MTHLLLKHADPAPRPGILHKLRHKARAAAARKRAHDASPFAVYSEGSTHVAEIIEKSTNKVLASGIDTLTNPHRVSVILAVLDAWQSPQNPQGCCGIDHLLMAINLPIIVSEGASLNAIKDLNNEGLQDVILYCPDNAIRKGVTISGKCILRNVLVIGGWQNIEQLPGSDLLIDGIVASIRAQTWSRSNPANSPIGQQGDQGGYAFYGVGKTLAISANGYLYCHCRSDGSDHQSTQYAFRTSGTRITSPTGGVQRLFLRGSDIKAFTSRMTDSFDNDICINSYGPSVSFGGGSAGFGFGTFTGSVKYSYFHLTGASKVILQPGVGQLQLFGCTSNKAEWLDASNG